MEQKNCRAALAAAREACAKKGEADAADIAKAIGIAAAEAESCIRQMDEENLAIVIEIDMCCGEEYVVRGLTEKGEALLREEC